MKKTIRNTFLQTIVAVSFTVILLFFNNCKGNTETALQLDQSSGAISDNLGSGATGTLCEKDIQNLYARGWQVFLKQNCAVCHANGPGKGRFANSDLKIAYGDFEAVGYTKVSANAVNSSHNPPYSGIQHTQSVNELKVEWQKGLQDYATCTGTAVDVPVETQIEKITLRSKPVALGAADDGVATPITIDLNTDITRIKGTQPLASVPGAKFTINVTRLKNAGGFSYYTFSSPKIFGSTVDIQIEGIFISVNGFKLTYPTTFSFVNKGIRAGSTNTAIGDTSGLVSTGSLVVPKVILPTDTVTISFINITKVTLPPPPPPVTVNVTSGNAVVVTPGTAYADISITLSMAASEPILVTFEVDNDLCGTAATTPNSNTLFKTISPTCLPAVYEAICPGGACAAAAKDFGRARIKKPVDTAYNRYDWDYYLPTASVTFANGESTKTIRVYFSRDVRAEQNRVVTLNIVNVLGEVIVGANKSVNFIINKYMNPMPDPEILTFAQLMNIQTGVLGQNCVKCHNSRDTAGGYDMTDYEMMINRRVLVPRDISSKMYVRMHPNPEFLAKPMPQDGFLESPKILEVEKWILDGAKNN